MKKRARHELHDPTCEMILESNLEMIFKSNIEMVEQEFLINLVPVLSEMLWCPLGCHRKQVVVDLITDLFLFRLRADRRRR